MAKVMGRRDAIKYKRNFLSQVLVRFDFYQFVPSELIFCNGIERVILGLFPHKGIEQIIRFNSVNIIVKNQNAEIQDARGESTEGQLWEYLAPNKKNKLVLTNKYMALEIKEYHTFEELKKWINKIWSKVFSNIPDLSVSRTGIRYVNLFESEQIKLQKNYFADEISSTLAIKLPNDTRRFFPIRSMHLMEYRDDSKSLNFRYGMYNPDYPNQLKRNSFVLDLDCFSNDMMENKEDMMRFLEDGHEAIQLVFEDSITDTLRGVLNHG